MLRKSWRNFRGSKEEAAWQPDDPRILGKSVAGRLPNLGNWKLGAACVEWPSSGGAGRVLGNVCPRAAGLMDLCVASRGLGAGYLLPGKLSGDRSHAGAQQTPGQNTT